MSALFEAQGLMGRAINVEIGASGNIIRVRWDMEITEGPHKGKIAKYSGKLTPDAAKWTKRDMKTIGWKGQSSATFVDDVKKANLVVPFNAEIASYNGNEWVSAKFGGGTPLAPLDNDAQRQLDRLLASVGGDDEETSGGGEQRDGVPF